WFGGSGGGGRAALALGDRVGGGAESRTFRHAELSIVAAQDLTDVRESRWGGAKRIGDHGGLVGFRVDHVGFGIVAGSGPVGSAAGGAEGERSNQSLAVADDWGQEHGSGAVARNVVLGLCAHLGGEVDQVIGDLE